MGEMKKIEKLYNLLEKAKIGNNGDMKWN